MQHKNFFFRRNDYENHLCCLRLADPITVAAFAIRAFNVEIAKIKDSVTENRIGMMKLQFWKDVIQEIYEGQARAHPVALLLSDVIQKHNLTKIWFNRLLNARETSLEDRPFMTIKEIEDYGENSVSPVNYLILESLGIKDVHADHVLSHIGKAISLSIVLRAMPFNAQRRRVFLPVDLLMKHKISQEDILRKRKPEVTSEIIYEVASQAHMHLEKARNMREKMPKQAAQVCLPAVSCNSYLEKIQKLDFNVFHPSLQQRDWKLPMKILLKSWRNSF
eukprot:Seg4855.1 transcript_id=Seg4855.1/GoldUCD/mRNA.D3Y31 product="NADH dehydrogenase complex I assembly factor 6" protein_id=Seg4855.1/GoldUCD/D3Y31